MNIFQCAFRYKLLISFLLERDDYLAGAVASLIYKAAHYNQCRQIWAKH